MWTEFEETLTPLFEFLGIPMVILTPLAIILYVLLKVIIPNMLKKNSKSTGLIVANIIAQMFGEGEDLIQGVNELDTVKLIKQLPLEVQNEITSISDVIKSNTEENDKKLVAVYNITTTKLNEVGELMGLLSQAMMSERLLKPQSSTALRQIYAKATSMIDDKTTLTDILAQAKEAQVVVKNIVNVIDDAKEISEAIVDLFDGDDNITKEV